MVDKLDEIRGRIERDVKSADFRSYFKRGVQIGRLSKTISMYFTLDMIGIMILFIVSVNKIRSKMKTGI